MKKSNKLTDQKLNRMLKQDTPKHIIYLHIRNEITLNDKQLNRLIKLKGDRNDK